ncbi:hypothetical protein RSAG8_03728, partial [Rhizoctonia solani AG-8 WAC10335]
MEFNTPTPSPLTDPNDPTFDPRPPSRRGTRSNLSAASAPKTVVSGGSCVSESVEEVLKILAPDGKRCLVTRDVAQIECCRVIARHSPIATLKKPERAWGIRSEDPCLSLDLNLLWLRKEMHGRFENFDWALVPTMKVLKEMVYFGFHRVGGPSSSNYLEKFADKIWDYHFVPFRRSPIVFERYDDSPQGYAAHDYPFANLGLLRSHVHPFFAVYNAGEKAIYHKKKKAEPNWDTDIPLGFEECLDVCVKLFNSWNKDALETLQPDVTSQPPRNPSHPPSTSGGRSRERSQQQAQDRDARAKRRRIDPAAHDPRQSSSGTGAPHGRERMTATSVTDQYLTTPELSVYSGDRENRLGIICSGTSLPSCHWTGVDDWAAGVESSAPCEDPYQGVRNMLNIH